MTCSHRPQTVRTAKFSRRLAGITALAAASILIPGPAALAGPAEVHGSIYMRAQRFAGPYVQVLDQRTGQTSRLTYRPNSIHYSPSVDAPGTRLAFATWQHSGDDPMWRIEMMKPDGNDHRVVWSSKNGGTVDSVSLNPAGTKIAFARGGDGAQIFVINTDGTGLQALTQPTDGFNYEPAWSPDGTRIAFVSNRTGSENVFVMDAGGGNVRRISLGDGDSSHPAWSPDGNRIAYHHTDPDNRTARVQWMDASGGDTTVHLVTGGERPAAQPSWCPDGKTIVYIERAANGQLELRATDLNLRRAYTLLAQDSPAEPDCGR